MPNGYDLIDGEEEKITFRELLEETLEHIACNAPGEASLMDVFMRRLVSASDVPQKAQPFVQKAALVLRAFNELGEYFESLMSPQEGLHAHAAENLDKKASKARSTINALLQSTQGNSALETIAKLLMEEFDFAVLFLKDMCGHTTPGENVMKNAENSLDELFEE